jgi:NitT/TauT family transport system ATP-binding protein
MSPSPGRIDSDMRVALDRPREVVASDFNEIRRELSAKLHSHHGRKAA